MFIQAVAMSGVLLVFGNAIIQKPDCLVLTKHAGNIKNFRKKKELRQMNKNKNRSGYLTDLAKQILYNLFCLAVIALILLALCCDWAEVFYPICK